MYMSPAMNTTVKISMAVVIAAIITAAYLYFGNIRFAGGTLSESAVSMTPPSGDRSVIINELMSSNKGFYFGDNGKCSDWVELYNTTDGDICMQNYALSDNSDKLDKWPFPAVTIKAYGYLVIFLTGDIVSDLEAGVIHCSFKLDSNGDSLFLTGAERKMTDSVSTPRLLPNVSYGRIDGEWQKSDSPTPGFENSDEGYREFIQSNG
jgi:hypothetical protein